MPSWTFPTKAEAKSFEPAFCSPGVLRRKTRCLSFSLELPLSPALSSLRFLYYVFFVGGGGGRLPPASAHAQFKGGSGDSSHATVYSPCIAVCRILDLRILRVVDWLPHLYLQTIQTSPRKPYQTSERKPRPSATLRPRIPEQGGLRI